MREPATLDPVKLLRKNKTMQQNKLFVSGFPYALTEEELKDSFSQAGTVLSAKIIMDHQTGRSRGFGFVEMSTDDEAQAAIEMWNERDLQGRRVIVNVAKPMEHRSNYKGDRGGSNRGQRDRRDYGDNE